MAIKTSKNKQPKKLTTTKSQRTAQIVFAAFAVILILSMILTATSKF
ncbi:MAG: hypothetical protein U0Z26_15120 [Anaerolineales bacterium]